MAGEPSQLGEATLWVIEQWAPVETQADEASCPEPSAVVEDLAAGVSTEVWDDAHTTPLPGESMPLGAASRGPSADAVMLPHGAQLQETDDAGSVHSDATRSTVEEPLGSGGSVHSAMTRSTVVEETQTADSVDDRGGQLSESISATAADMSTKDDEQAETQTADSVDDRGGQLSESISATAADMSTKDDQQAVRVYHGFTEHTYRLVFPFEDKFAPDAPHLFTVLPSGVVENNKVLEPQKDKGLIAFTYPQNISDELAELPVGQQPGSNVDSSAAKGGGQLLRDTAFVWRRQDGTNAVVQTWPTNLNDKFRQDFEISEGMNPDSGKYLPQAVSEFQEAMVRLFGPAAATCPLLFCHKQLTSTSPAVVGIGEEVLAHLKECPDLMRELAIASIDTDGLGFMADGINGKGQQFEKHFRLTPGEECVVYRKTGWDTMGCIKPLHQFLHDAEFHGPPIAEEPAVVEKEVAATMEIEPSETLPEETNEPVAEIEPSETLAEETQEPVAEIEPSETLAEETKEPIAEAEPSEALPEETNEPVAEIEPSETLPEETNEPVAEAPEVLAEETDKSVAEARAASAEVSEPVVEEASNSVVEAPAPVPEESSKPVAEAPDLIPEDSNKSVVEASEPTPEEANKSDVEASDIIPNDANKSFVEVLESTPEEADKSIVEALDGIPEDANKYVVEASEPTPEEANKSTVEALDHIPEDANESIVEAAEPTPEEATGPKPEQADKSVVEVSEPISEKTNKSAVEATISASGLPVNRDVVRAPPPSPTKALSALAKSKVAANAEAAKDPKRPCPTPARARSPPMCNTPSSSEKGRTSRKSGMSPQGSQSNGTGANAGSPRPRTPSSKPAQQKKASTGNAGSVNSANHKVPSTAEREEAEIAEKRRQLKIIAERNARHMTRVSAARNSGTASSEDIAKDRSPQSVGPSRRRDIKAGTPSQERRSASLTKTGSGASSGGTAGLSRIQQSKNLLQKRPTTSPRPTGCTATPRKPSPQGELTRGASPSAPGKRTGALVNAPSSSSGKTTGEVPGMSGKATPSRPQSRPRTPTRKREQVAAAVAVFTRPGHATKNLQLGPATRATADRRSPSQQKAPLA